MFSFHTSSHRLCRPYIVASGLLLSANACVEKVVQTAELGSAAELPAIDCEVSSATEPPRFEDQPEADEGAASPLVTGSYDVSEGPGLSVAAKDAFRVYLNGVMIFESSAIRSPIFLPLSLAPGDNVIGVSVVAENGNPAALVHLSELSRDYVSDDSWKTNIEAGDRWYALDYDDAEWASAVELANRGEAPGCDPETDFPTNSQAHWIGSSFSSTKTAVFRKTIAVKADGFAEGTTGGGSGTPVLVGAYEELEATANSDDPKVLFLAEGTYDFRKTGTEIEEIEVCPVECPSVPGKNQLNVLIEGETCENELVAATRDERQLRIGSNTTLVGLGRGAQVRGVTFDFQEKENIIVRNIALFDINAHLLEAGDAFGLTRPKNIWIDHGSVKWVSDGFTDLREGTAGVTLSHMHYDADEEAACDGQHRWTSEITDAEVTIHHSRFDHASTRTPLVRGATARVHLYNNVFSNTSEWAVGSLCLSQVLLEGNTFENVDAATWLGACSESGELGLIEAPAGSNLYRGTSSVHLGGDGNEPHDSVFDVPYDYLRLPASEAWPEVISRAGTGGPWALPLVKD